RRAFELNKRYIDQDLNRSFPGKKNGNYEEKLAYKLLPIIKSADVVLDIHSTTSESKDAIIVTKLNNKILKCINSIQPKNVLIMNATKNNALISQAKIGIAFEYGKDDDSVAIKKTFEGIKKLLNYLKIINLKYKKTNKIINYFNVTSVVPKPKGYKLIKKIKNYKLIKKGSVYAINKNKKILATEDFYPILFGEKKYENIFGFKGKKFSSTKIKY
ncbi:MAG: succinylglutamate desuccinylase/aspartoacylase family protein, partial [Minisyncoccales bacterium]